MVNGSQTLLFAELFYEIYLARARWHESPRAPFDVSSCATTTHKVY